MRYEYVIYLSKDPFGDEAPYTLRGFVEAVEKYEAYALAHDAVPNEAQRYLMNWYTRPSVEGLK